MIFFMMVNAILSWFEQHIIDEDLNVCQGIVVDRMFVLYIIGHNFFVEQVHVIFITWIILNQI